MPYSSPLDPTQIGPGWWGFVVFVVLVAATVLLLRSCLHHLRRVQAGPNEPPTLQDVEVERSPRSTGSC